MSLRALALGAVLGAIFAAAGVYTGSKAAIIEGGNIPAVLVGFAVLSVFGRRATSHEANLVQTVTSSAAYMAITGGVVGPIAALALAGHELSLPAVAGWGIAVGVAGCLLAVPLREAFVVRGQLAFPSAIAIASVIETIEHHRAGRRLLVAGALVAAALAVARDVLEWFPAQVMLPVAIASVPAAVLSIGVHASPLYLAIGSLLGMRMGISMLLGAIVAWVIAAPALVDAGIVATPDYSALLQWLLWPGVGLMIGGTLAGVVTSWSSLRAGVRALGELRSGARYLVAVMVACTAVGVLGYVAFDVGAGFSLLAIAMSVLLCASAARAAGETDNPPVGALGGLGQLAAGAAAPAALVPPLVTGGVIQGTAMHATVMLGNWKAGHLLRAPAGPQLVAQLVGVVVGAIASVATFELLRTSYGLANEAMPVPWAQSWKATAELVQHGLAAMPEHAALAAGIACALGVVLGLVGERLRWLPSPVALGTAFVLPASMSITIALGGLLAWFAARRYVERDVTVIASGVVAGEAVVGLVALLCTTLRT